MTQSPTDALQWRRWGGGGLLGEPMELLGGAVLPDPATEVGAAGKGRSVLRRRRLLSVPFEDVPAGLGRKASTDEERFEVPGTHVDLGHLDAAEVIRLVHPVVVEEPATDHVPLVDDRTVDLEDDQQPVG